SRRNSRVDADRDATHRPPTHAMPVAAKEPCMSCHTPSTRPLPRRSLLAGSLAAALAMAAPAAAMTPQEKHDLIETVLPAHLDAGQRETLRRQLQRTVRTPPPVPAGSPVVSNCNDSGAGSLRKAVAAAAEGDTIDLTQLSCSFITLTSGEIV